MLNKDNKKQTNIYINLSPSSSPDTNIKNKIKNEHNLRIINDNKYNKIMPYNENNKNKDNIKLNIHERSLINEDDNGNKDSQYNEEDISISKKTKDKLNNYQKEGMTNIEILNNNQIKREIIHPKLVNIKDKNIEIIGNNFNKYNLNKNIINNNIHMNDQQDYRSNYNNNDIKKLYLKNNKIKEFKEPLKFKKEEKIYHISSLDESTPTMYELRNMELNDMILYFIYILYHDVDKLLNNKSALKLYDSKIEEIASLIVYMDDVDQIKVMEAMNMAAVSYNQIELFNRLSDKVDEMNKIKKGNKYKNINIMGKKEGYTYRESIRKSINK